jgi:membrane-associated protease RseP (regulator of RpoE activity)
MLKTSYLNQRLDFISRKRERFWRRVWNIGVILAFCQMTFIIYFLSSNLLELAYRTPQAAGMIVLLPGVTVSLETLPYIIAALALVLLTHEFAHALASITDGIPLKSSGLFFALVFPGAFVELDEEKLEKSTLPTKLRVFASGSSANIAAWLLVSLLLTNFSTSISLAYQESSGILVSGIVDGGNARSELRRWDVIYAIDGHPIDDVDELSRFMSGLRSGTIVSVKTDRGIVNVETRPHPQNSSRALLGIYPFKYYKPALGLLPKELPYHLYWTEYWSSALLLWIAIFNMLPMYPLDGGKIVDSLVSSRSKSAARIVKVGLSTVFMVIVGLNMALSIFNFGIIRI